MTQSAGIVLWRRRSATSSTALEVLLAHPGGPFWAKKDEHAWSIPKGEFDPGAETAVDAARREFEEELGTACPDATTSPLVTIPPFRAGRKTIHAFAVEGDFDPAAIDPEDRHRSLVTITWPPRSDRTIQFPEVDRVEWFSIDQATAKLHKGQAPVVAGFLAVLGDPCRE